MAVQIVGIAPLGRSHTQGLLSLQFTGFFPARVEATSATVSQYRVSWTVKKTRHIGCRLSGQNFVTFNPCSQPRTFSVVMDTNLSMMNRWRCFWAPRGCPPASLSRCSTRRFRMSLTLDLTSCWISAASNGFLLRIVWVRLTSLGSALSPIPER